MSDFKEYSAAFHYQNGDVMHFGILGMKWGVRRYQNGDGTLTAAGRKRYDKTNKVNKPRAKAAKRDTSEKDTSEKQEKQSSKIDRIEALEEKRRDILTYLYANEKNMAKAADEYYEAHPEIKKRMTKEQHRNWCVYDDGWQDSKDDWYIETYHKDLEDELIKLYKSR